MKVKMLLMAVMAPIVAVFANDDGMADEQAALLGTDKPAEQQTVALRDTKISADHMEYNYKESVAILTDNVVVDDARFHLTADKLFVFMVKNDENAPKAEKSDGGLGGKNKLEQLYVVGNVKVVNENRRAYCDKALYTEADEKLVLTGNAVLVNIDKNGKESRVKGDKITIWTADQRMEVYPRPVLEFPGGASDGLKGITQ